MIAGYMHHAFGNSVRPHTVGFAVVDKLKGKARCVGGGGIITAPTGHACEYDENKKNT
jgi:hypothetical protein